MFVLKSTLAKVEAERDCLLHENERLRAMVAITSHKAVYYAARERDKSLTLAAARAELRTTYVRDAKGRITRHPSHALAPSPETFASETRKDRSGKHGSEVA